MLKRFNGFTLIEMLVVVIIISIVATAATLTIYSHSSQQTTALCNALKNRIQLAQEEALLRGMNLGIIVKNSSLQFVEYDPKKHAWNTITNNELKPFKFPNHTTLVLDKENQKKPMITITANGDISPFQLKIANKELNVSASGDVNIV